MKILFCCEFYAPSVGGVQEVIRQLAERLAARGHEVTVATTALPARQFTELRGVRIEEFTVSGNLVKGMQGELNEYRQFVTTGSFDIVVIKAAQQWTFDALWPVLQDVRGKKAFIPCGFSCLYEPDYAKYFEDLPRVLRQFDHLIFYASDYRDIAFAKQHGCSKWSIIPNGASETEFNVLPDRSFRRRHGIDEHSLLFLTVGSPASMKGHYEIAEAFLEAEFSGRPATLVLNAGSSIGHVRSVSGAPVVQLKVYEYVRALGEVYERDGLWAAVTHMCHGLLNKAGIRAGRYAVLDKSQPPAFQDVLTDLIRRIHKQHAGKRVVLTDLPRPDLIQAYIEADLFLFASRVEYSPLVLFESAAAGTPFLSVPVGNSPEIAEWTGAGVICPASRDERGYTIVDAKVFGAQWSSLVSNMSHLKHLGKAGRRNWAARFTWNAITDQYESLFKKVALHA
ncbi:hypothetical protein W02_16120 [Nitrospira sp. KM1]|uniref:glycosyltransferase family 4 protein n=1 Tax=Nitrospira sp. KM1 TaxID=1936990 RepID=UPI0013A7B307|nr:glycosyltransferase family 4 protein [Nitrospira sp. KM1]BCA54472.1 hypothetical protein W02_16120 [Nitrospira sp. KM1]